ncbi:MAG TPA: thiamine pyrophosphate-binding protein [Xanthobacteraceae bacterium]|nr:thiamine pyrophosphate-binding protein [Xanthobacteraceae bacterium]
MQLTGGQALARQLVREGITDVFGIPGVQLDWAVDGLREVSNRIRYVVTRHEQAASYMADGYARTTGRVGACMVVPGPGLLNAMAGLATAYACNSRVLAIVGNIHSPAIGKGYGLLHEVRNQSAILGCVTKWQAQAGKPADVPTLVRAAVKELWRGRPQPVGLEIAPDVLSTRADVTLIDPPAHEDGAKRPDPATIEKAAQLIAMSRFPVIYAGGGVLAAGATAALQALAERLSAPVVTSENGRGALSDRHPLALNALAGRAVFAHADVVLVVGSRFADTTFGMPAWQAAGIEYVWLNVDPAAWNPPRSAAVGICGDARLGLEALAAALPRRQPNRDVDLDKVRAWASEQVRGAEPQMSYIRALRAAIPEDGVLVSELTQVGYLARSMYPVFRPGTFLTPGYQGTLGYGFPTALGVAAGNPGRPVVSMNGDGGFGWAMQELATLRKYNLNVAVVVFADGQFGNVLRFQEAQFGATYETDLCNPAFDRLAAAFDVPFGRAESPEALQSLLSRAVRDHAPILIEAPVGPMSSPWGLMRLQARPGAADSGPPNPLGEPVR